MAKQVLPDKKLEDAGYTLKQEDDEGVYYVKNVGNKRVGISIPVHFSEDDWAITTSYIHEMGHWSVASYGDFPASDLDEVIELNAKFLEGEL